MGNIVLEHVHKAFGATVIIPDIDLDIGEGEFVVFVGPSGCGKSTLLRLIAGLEDTTSGRIVIDGRDVTGEAPAKRQLAMVFQSYALYPHMTVRQNIAFPLKMAGSKARPSHRQARSPTRRASLNLTDYLDRRPRTAVGRPAPARRHRPGDRARAGKAFLFDEPLSNLDAALRVNMRLEIYRAAPAAQARRWSTSPTTRSRR